MSDRTFLIVFASAAYLFAGIFGASGIVLHSRSRRLITSAKATIISLERSATMSSYSVTPTVTPYFRFTDRYGLEHCVRSSEGALPETYQVGDIVEVFYDSASPQCVYIHPERVKQMARVCIFAAGLAGLVATVMFASILFR
jgi:hypothetical protein